MIGRTIVPALALSLIIALAALPPRRADGVEEKSAVPLDPSSPSQARRGDPITYDIDYSVIVTAPGDTRILKVWLPLPPSDASQEVEPGELTTFPHKVDPRIGTEKVYGNRFAYFEFDRPDGAQIIRHRFRAKIWEQHWDVDAGRVVPVKKWPASFGPYLKGDAAVALDDTIASALRGVVKQRTGPARDLDEIMAWLQENMKYDHAKASLSADSRRALRTRAGDCGDYHGLCASFGRVLGLPTRVVYGLHTFPKNSPSHCKMEAYLPPYGWVSFDVSETQKMVKAIQADRTLDETARSRLLKAANERLKRGFRDNTWLLQTRGTDYELVPPASRKVKLVRTIYAEADGRPLPDPDPADPAKTEFAWMTAHRFTPDRPVAFPFKDRKSLQAIGE